MCGKAIAKLWALRTVCWQWVPVLAALTVHRTVAAIQCRDDEPLVRFVFLLSAKG